MHSVGLVLHCDSTACWCGLLPLTPSYQPNSLHPSLPVLPPPSLSLPLLCLYLFPLPVPPAACCDSAVLLFLIHCHHYCSFHWRRRPLPNPIPPSESPFFSRNDAWSQQPDPGRPLSLRIYDDNPDGGRRRAMPRLGGTGRVGRVAEEAKK